MSAAIFIIRFIVSVGLCGIGLFYAIAGVLIAGGGGGAQSAFDGLMWATLAFAVAIAVLA